MPKRQRERASAEVKDAVVKGRPTNDDPIESIDLVEELLSTDHPIQLGSGRRYSRGDRWEAASQALKHWVDTGELQVAP